SVEAITGTRHRGPPRTALPTGPASRESQEAAANPALRRPRSAFSLAQKCLGNPVPRRPLGRMNAVRSPVEICLGNRLEGIVLKDFLADLVPDIFLRIQFW